MSRLLISALAFWLCALFASAQTTVSFQAPATDTPGFDGTWLDGFGGGNNIYAANNQIRAGRNGSGVNGVARGLVRFDPDTQFGRYSAVTAMSLELTTAGYSTSTTGGTLELYALPAGDSGWSAAQSTKNQKNKAYAYNWAAGSADANGFKTLPTGSVLATASYAANQASGQKITFNFTGSSSALTTLLDDLIESRCGGFLIKAHDESVTGSDVYFHSAGNATLGNRPKLTVTYTPGYKVMGGTEASAFLSRQLSYFGTTWDTSVTPNRVKESGGVYEMDRNARYAHALLDTGIAANFPAAEGIISYIRSQQILSPGNKYEHGHIRYQSTTTSAATSNPVLHDFCTLTLLSIKLLHYSKLSTTAQADLDAMLPLAVTWTRENRGAGVIGITNQETASWAVLLLGGQAYADSLATTTGTNFWGQTWTYVANTNSALAGLPNITEFVSPTYQFVTLENLALLKRYLTGNATILGQARTYYRWIWDEMARHYHAPSKLFAGPYSRCYSDLNGALGGTDYMVAYGIGGFKNGAFAYPLSSTLGPHTARTPAEFLPFFNDALPAARTDTDIFYHGPAIPTTGDNASHHITNHGVVPITGRTYIHPSYTAASLNFGKAGQSASGTKRPVLVTWGDGTAGNAIALSLQTVINTGDVGATLKETQRPVIFTSQEDGSSNILAGVTWSQNLNDPQVDWTNPTSSTFTASDLRVRIAAVRGNSTPPSVTLPATLTDPVAITFGGVTTTVKLAYQDFSGFTPVWQTSTSGSARYLDLVIYQGAQQTFNLATLARFTAAIALTTGTSGLVSQIVTPTPGTGNASIACGANLLLYPTKPDTIHALARSYRELSSQTPLGAPLNLASATPAAPAVALTWTDRANAETGFLVERRAAGEASWTSLATLAADTTTYTDATAAAATEYSYRVHTLTTGNAIAATSATTTLIVPGIFTNPAAIHHAQAAGGTAARTFTLNNVSASAQTFTLSVPTGGSSYTLTRSGQIGGPTYGWIDIGPSSATPGAELTFTAVGGFTASDEGRASFNLPAGFSFPYYGTTFAAGSPLYVSTNGFVTPTSFTGNTYSISDLSVSSNGVANMIAPFWRDLDVKAGAWVGWRQIDPSTIVVSFIDVRDFSGSGSNTFQLILKTDGSILFQYQAISAQVYGYSIGLKNADRTQGISAGFNAYSNTGIPTTGTALRFTPPASWLASIAPTSVTVPALSSTGITANLNLAGLTNGQTYNSQVSINSNLIWQPAISVPVTLEVTAALPGTAPSYLAIANINGNSVTLTWTDNSSNENFFSIERRLTGGTWAEVAQAARNATTFTDVLASAPSNYEWRLRARNGNGDSAYSDTVTAAPPATAPPTAPTALAVATVTSSTQLTLTWTDNATDETGFKLERSPDGSNGWTQIATTPANATTHTDTSLAAATPYFYRLRATNAIGDSSYTNIATATTLPAVPPPAAPSSLAVSPVTSSTQLTLTWSDNASDETGFQLERSADGVSGWSQIATPAADATSFTHTGLSPASTHHYRIRATGTGGESAWSNTASGSTLEVPPAAPSALAVATPTSTSQLTVTWTDNATNESGFQLERSPDGSSNWTQIASPAANAASFTHTGLSASTTHHYRIRATNAAGDSAYSNTANATTLSSNTLTATYQNGVSPTAGYTGNQGRATSSFGGGNTTSDDYIGSLGDQGRFITPIRFNNLSTAPGWIDPNTVGYSVSDISLTLKVSTNTLNGSGTLALVFNNRGNNSAWTETGVTQNTINGSTAWGGPAGKLSGASTTAGTSVAPFTTSGAWDIGSSGAFNAMPIMATAVVSNNTITTVGSNVTFTFSGLSAAEKLELIQIWSHNYASSLTVGDSTYTANPGMFLSFSATSSYTSGDIRFHGDNATTLANRPVLSITYSLPEATPPPAAPSSLAVATVTSSTELTLNWTDNASNETGFKLERSPDGSAGWTQIATPAANATTYTDTGLATGTPYFYRLRATNGGGDSAYSNTASATTLPSPPAAPTALAIATVSSSSQLTLTWTDNSTNENGFKLERSPDGSTGWSQIATPAANATSFTDTGLAAATPYFYRLRATNAAGDSAFTVIVSATTWSAADAWRVTWFGSAANAGSAADAADPDGDGVSNSDEFAQNTDPTNPGAPATASPPSLPARVFTFAPAADVHVTASAPSTNSGTASDLLVRTSENETFLRYDLSSLSGTVERAQLVFWTTATNGDSPTYNAEILPDGSDNWSETALTWATKPASSATGAATLTGTLANDTPQRLDVTTLVATTLSGDAAKLLGLRLHATGTMTANASFGSRENAASRKVPYLHVTLRPSAAAPVRLMHVGDSITRGANGGLDTNSFSLSGHRGYLHNLLLADGADFRAVGPLNHGAISSWILFNPTSDWPNSSALLDRPMPFPASAGYSGQTIGYIRDNIGSWMTTHSPEVITLMIGTNDILASAANATAGEIDNWKTAYTTLLNNLLAANAGAKVVIAKIPPLGVKTTSPTADYTPRNAGRIEPFNTQVVQALFDQFSAAYPGKFFLVDNYAAITTADIGPDGIHPGSIGHQKIARAWHPGIMAALGRSEEVVFVNQGLGADASLRGGINATTAFGNAASPIVPAWVNASLRVKADPSADARAKALLKFDLAGLPEKIGSATLGLVYHGSTPTGDYSASEGPVLHLYGVLDGSDAWTKSAVTWNSAPGHDAASNSVNPAATTYLASVRIPANSRTGDLITFNSTALREFLTWKAGADHLASFIIVAAGATTTEVVFAASNVKDYPPAFLSITPNTGATYADWSASHFELSADRSPTADPDADGIKNLLEYALGGIPTQPFTGILPVAGTATSGPQKFLTLSFTRARADLTYTVEASNDLLTWPDTVPFALPAVGATATATDTVDMLATPRRFLRLRVSQP